MTGPWTTLFQAVEAHRAGDYLGLDAELRAALSPLKRKGLPVHACWVGQRADGGRTEIAANNGKPIALAALPPGIPDAQLRVLCLVTRDRRRLIALDFLVDGHRADADASPFWIGLHLPAPRDDGRPDGVGPCSHPALHCHVGPDHGSSPQVRVPLPPMRPGALLSWLLCQVYPDLEPEPWER